MHVALGPERIVAKSETAVYDFCPEGAWEPWRVQGEWNDWGDRRSVHGNTETKQRGRKATLEQLVRGWGVMVKMAVETTAVTERLVLGPPLLAPAHGSAVR